jgi:hypothetical protein
MFLLQFDQILQEIIIIVVKPELQIRGNDLGISSLYMHVCMYACMYADDLGISSLYMCVYMYVCIYV